MESITGIWIIDEKGVILFNYEAYPQGSQEVESVLMQGFIFSIEKFVNELGEKQTERIELGKTKILLSKDEETKFVFALKATQHANIKTLTKLLNKIQRDFIKSFKPYFSKYDPQDLRLYISTIFKEYIENLLKTTGKDRMAEFFEKT